MTLDLERSRIFSVHDYGTVGDGVALDTAAIQAAVDACAAARGGTVFVPAGVYRIGTVELKDNVTLHLAADATLLGSKARADYGLAGVEDAKARHLTHCLIYARGAKHVSVTGQGTIDGHGAAFPCVSRQDSLPAFRGEVNRKPQEKRKAYFRPLLVIFVDCENVVMRDVRVKDSASWGVHFVTCDGVRVEGVRVDNRARSNGDGLDLESSRNVFISNCHIDCDDDAICLKSSIADRPVENVVVTNCVISSNTAAVKFGTPSRAGFRNIAISNCVFHDCGMGAIKLEVVDGGTLEDVVFSNLTMHNVEGPLFVRLGNRASRFSRPSIEDEDAPAPVPVGVLRNILISNVRATVRNVYVDDPMERVDVPGQAMLGMLISGIPGHPVEGLMLSDMHITFPGGGTLEDAAIEVPEDETMYPERFFFGVIPAYGAFIRHAKGITFHNVRFELTERDLRPALVFEDVVDLELDSFRAMGDVEAECVVRLKNTQDVFVHNSRALNEVARFVKEA